MVSTSLLPKLVERAMKLWAGSPIRGLENALMKLEEKLDKLTEELSDESNHEKQESLLRSINSLVEIIKKMKD